MKNVVGFDRSFRRGITVSWKSITLAHTVKDCGAYFTASLNGETFVVTASRADWPVAKARLAAIAVEGESNE